MQEELQAIKEAQESGDHAQAVALSDAYVAANPDVFTDMKTMNVEQLVAAVDAFRATEMETNLWQVQAWLSHHYEPQQIGGVTEPTVRVATDA